MRCWLEDSWLVAIVEAVPADEVRRWWNVKDTELLDHIVETAPAVHLGAVATCVDVTCDCRIEPPSPARRVFELLVLRGTCPEEFTVDETDPYVMPLLDEELRTALLAASRAAMMTFLCWLPATRKSLRPSSTSTWALIYSKHRVARVARS